MHKPKSHPTSRFPVMAVLAKGLPVFFVPEQLRVAPVRRDMIDHRRGRQSTVSHTLYAQGMFPQIPLSSGAPFGIVSSGISAAAHSVGAVLLMILAVHLAPIADVGASRESAGSFRSVGHIRHLVR